MQKNVLAIALDGFEDTELVAPIDILRRGGVKVDFATPGKTTIESSHGFSFTKILDLNKIDLSIYDAVLLPGGSHYKACLSSKEIISTLKYFHDQEKFLCSLCAGPTILGSLGYLKGKNYTCFTKMNKDFGGTYHYTYTVRDGNLITGQAAGAAIEFGLEILEALVSVDEKVSVMKSIYY